MGWSVVIGTASEIHHLLLVSLKHSQFVTGTAVVRPVSPVAVLGHDVIMPRDFDKLCFPRKKS